MSAVDPGDWMKRGFCTVRKVDPDIFFDDATEELAKSFCRRCVVRQECLTWATDTHQEGVWGGLTSDERRRVARVVPHRANCLGCGGIKIYSDGVNEICLGCGLTWRITVYG